MRTRRTIPFATLALALVITVIQLLKASGGNSSQFVTTNLNVLGWESLYNEPWRILTSPFTHKNLLHFAENLLFLLLFGRQIEPTYGRRYLLGAFFGALVTGHVTFINLKHDSIVGISGGVCGLFGFSLIANRRTPWWTTLTHRPLHALYFANLIWAVIVDVNDWLPFSVAHLNHLVGILYGAAFAVAFLLTRRDAIWRWVNIALPLVLFASQFYSPWQVEWRLLRREPMLVTREADCSLPSTVQDTFVSTATKFVNASANGVALYWLDYEGGAHLYKWLGPGNSYKQNTYIGHLWCVVDAGSGRAIQAVKITESEQTVTLR